MRSTQGEIEVFLCPDEAVPKPLSPTSPAQTTASTTTTSPPQPFSSKSSYYSSELLPNGREVKIEPVPTPEKEIKQENHLTLLSSSAGMRDALLGESEDFNLISENNQLQTEEQGQSLGKKKISLTLFHFFIFSSEEELVLYAK